MPWGNVEPSWDFPACFLQNPANTGKKNISKQGRQQVDLRTARFQLKLIRTALHLLSFSPNIQSRIATPTKKNTNCWLKTLLNPKKSSKKLSRNPKASHVPEANVQVASKCFAPGANWRDLVSISLTTLACRRWHWLLKLLWYFPNKLEENA